MNKKQNKCNHIWKHRIKKGQSILQEREGGSSLWLEHYCSKCNLTTETSEKIEDNVQEDSKKEKQE